MSEYFPDSSRSTRRTSRCESTIGIRAGAFARGMSIASSRRSTSRRRNVRAEAA